MSQLSKTEKRLSILIGLQIGVCCISLVIVAAGVLRSIDHYLFHIQFRLDALWIAFLAVAAFSTTGGILFVFCRFSFGYFVGFYFFSMILSFLWLTCFSDLPYNHLLAGCSAAISFIIFLLPALLLSAPLKYSPELSIANFDRIISLIICLVAVVVLSGTYYSFAFPVGDLASAREGVVMPAPIRYLVWTSSSALLPFAFAYCLARRWYRRLIVVVVLQLLLFPVTVTKTALFAPFWLAFLHLLSRLTTARSAVILSLLLPMSFVLLLLPFGPVADLLFSTLNFRMVAIPALALDIYNDFFSRNQLTLFCQISILKPLLACPYHDQLSIIMQNQYHLGYFNASLFATEGIASVGAWLAPLSALLCGIVVSVGNRVSAGLPPSFVLVSAGVLVQVLLNVPITVATVTHGAVLLCLMWYFTPRAIFVRTENIR
ncbi:hypothetical protein [Bradyrhizobium sp. STM 3562]|uniref:hypothetical protein n=1 Tax=Bradyrhizobium sp. STM 3562 TaxID=578924 RepID=UPI003890E299